MKRIGIIGGGPAGLFLYKRIIETAPLPAAVVIFEKTDQLGSGMPYSHLGANKEHVTNVSGNEIPTLVTPIKEWIHNCPPHLLKRFHISPGMFNDYKVLPRLLFGEYLASQFELLQKNARQAGIKTTVHYDTTVSDIFYDDDTKHPSVITTTGDQHWFDDVVICIGHKWPKQNEGKMLGWYDSPYPPAKLEQLINFPVAIKGSSLTAIDAVRTLARQNGCFSKLSNNRYDFKVNDISEGFRMVLYSIKGLLPAIRFHLDDSHLSVGTTLGSEEINQVKSNNEGFVPLDYIFDQVFKQPLREKNSSFYELIRNMTMEEFVDHMLGMRESLDPFTLFKAEYMEAERSIRNRQSVYWKEMLAILSYEMNYPAKYFSAEDMLRLKKVLMPLISVVIAFVPQSSARELMALHDAGILEVVSVDSESEVIPLEEGGCQYQYTDESGVQQRTNYKMFINAIGQPPFMMEDFPFRSLADSKVISRATLKFKSSSSARQLMEDGNKDVIQFTPHDYYLNVPGININDNFQVLNEFGGVNKSIYIMAVPYVAGLNPDYSGLDFCETASKKIADTIFSKDDAEQTVAA